MSEMDPAEAMNRVEELTDYESIGCSDCGHPVDLSGAGSPLEVVAALANHQNEHHSGP